MARKYTCEKCDSSFTRRWSLGRHSKTKHGSAVNATTPIDARNRYNPVSSHSANVNDSISYSSLAYIDEYLRALARLEAADHFKAAVSDEEKTKLILKALKEHEYVLSGKFNIAKDYKRIQLLQDIINSTSGDAFGVFKDHYIKRTTAYNLDADSEKPMTLRIRKKEVKTIPQTDPGKPS